jgi:Stress responsive A/B Barrel Domain
VITHVVMFRWKSDMPEGHVAVIAQSLDTLPPAIEAIRTYQHGADLGISASGSADYVIIATFDSVDAWREYDAHPVHDAARAEIVRPWTAERWAVQFES